ncbi:MAG: hypothetical protein ABIH52_03295, partial [Candidatus Aenigmatarchaeota archaeon]
YDQFGNIYPIYGNGETVPGSNGAPDTVKIRSLTVPLESIQFSDKLSFDMPEYTDRGKIAPDGITEPNTRLMLYGDGKDGKPCLRNSREALRKVEQSGWKADAKKRENDAKQKLKGSKR